MALYLCKFVDESVLKQLEIKTGASIAPGRTQPMEQIERELSLYFSGKQTHFQSPLHLKGSPFQTRVWEELQKIPFGETRSYAELAAFIEKPTACRAVAQANSQNPFAIIVPCHRVISSNGALGGYNGGSERKRWLLKHEQASQLRR